MNYHIHNTNKDEPLIKRILKAKNIHDNYEDFLNPTFGKYRIPPSLLSDIDKACERIQQAIKNKEKIMIFGDYDVD
jgi:single-stranded-DNA-specific exonuclease